MKRIVEYKKQINMKKYLLAARLLFIICFLALLICSVAILWTPHQVLSTNEGTAISSKLQVIEMKDTSANSIQIDYLDYNGLLTIASDLHYARTVKYYDELQRLTAEEFYDNSSKLTLLPKGYAVIRYEYDDDGRTTSERYYGVYGELRNITAGYAMKDISYAEDGKTVIEMYFSSELLPVQSTDGCYGVKRVYNDQRQNILMECLDADGSRTNCRRGYSVERREFDSLGRLEKVQYYDKENHPTPIETGEYAVQYQYAEGVQIRSYLNEWGQVASNSLGYATVQQSFRTDGSLYKQLYFDLDGSPVEIVKGRYGILYYKGANFYLNRYGIPTVSLLDIPRLFPISIVLFGCALCIIAIVMPQKWLPFYLVMYLCFIAEETLFRVQMNSQEMLPFFSSLRMLFFDQTARVQAISNIWLFIPFGAGAARMKKNGVLYLALLPVFVESLQWGLKLGYFEFDDIILNAVGGIIGYKIVQTCFFCKNVADLQGNKKINRSEEE